MKYKISKHNVCTNPSIIYYYQKDYEVATIRFAKWPDGKWRWSFQIFFLDFGYGSYPSKCGRFDIYEMNESKAKKRARKDLFDYCSKHVYDKNISESTRKKIKEVMEKIQIEIVNEKELTFNFI